MPTPPPKFVRVKDAFLYARWPFLTVRRKVRIAQPVQSLVGRLDPLLLQLLLEVLA
jgi:hypothetical protein